jgi:hypothetical protein
MGAIFRFYKPFFLPFFSLSAHQGDNVYSRKPSGAVCFLLMVQR